MAEQERKEFIISFVADTAQARQIRDEINKLTNAKTKLSKAAQGASAQMVNLAKRAALTIPVWLALRAVVNGISNEFREGIKYIIDFDKALARAGAVTSGVKNIDSFLNDTLKPLTRTLSIETGKSVAEITEAFYRFGTAGLVAEESIAGMNVAVKTSVALMGDTQQTATALADVYNILGNSVDGAVTPQEKFQKIAGSIAVLYKRNAFELGQFSDAITKFGAIASNANLTFDQTSSLIATLASFGIRGSQAGTVLARTFTYLEKEADLVNSILGKKGTGLNSNFERFIALIDILNTKDTGKGISRLNEDLIELFGVKGTKGAATLANNLESLRKNYEALTKLGGAERFAVLNEEFERQTKTLSVQIDIFKNLKRVSFEAFVTSATGAADLTQAMIQLNSFIQTYLIPTMVLLGTLIDDLNLTKFENFKVAGPLGAGSSKSFIEGLKNKIQDIFSLDKDKGTISIDFTQLFAKYKTNLDKVRGKGADAEYLARVKAVKEEMKLMEEKAAADRESEMRLELRLKQFDKLKLLGFSDLDIAKQKLEELKKEVDVGEQRLKLEEQILELQQKQVEEIGEKLKSSVESGLKDVILGEATFSDLGSQIGSTIKETMAEQLAGGITDVVASSGLFEGFGNFGVSIRELFSGPKSEMYNAVYHGTLDANKATARNGSIAQSIARVSGTGGSGGLINLGGLTSGGGGGWLSDKFSGFFNPDVSKMYGVTGGQIGPMTRGQSVSSSIRGSIGGAARNIAANFGLYSAIASAVISGAQTVYKGVQQQGAGNYWAEQGKNIFATTNPFGTYMNIRDKGIREGVRSMLDPLELISKRTRKSVTEKISTQEISVASKVDVSNRKLEMINRNLIAFKQSFETYILPESSYFAETGGADNYKLSFNRG